MERGSTSATWGTCTVRCRETSRHTSVARPISGPRWDHTTARTGPSSLVSDNYGPGRTRKLRRITPCSGTTPSSDGPSLRRDVEDALGVLVIELRLVLVRDRG